MRCLLLICKTARLTIMSWSLRLLVREKHIVWFSLAYLRQIIPVSFYPIPKVFCKNTIRNINFFECADDACNIDTTDDGYITCLFYEMEKSSETVLDVGNGKKYVRCQRQSEPGAVSNLLWMQHLEDMRVRSFVNS